MRKKLTTIKRLWIVIGILVLLSPLGIILPELFGAGGAWGEWGVDEIEKLVGYAPQGMKRLADVWKAPMPDYPGQGEGTGRMSIGYFFTAAVGVAVTAGTAYLLMKILARRERSAGKK